MLKLEGFYSTKQYKPKSILKESRSLFARIRKCCDLYYFREHQNLQRKSYVFTLYSFKATCSILLYALYSCILVNYCNNKCHLRSEKNTNLTFNFFKYDIESFQFKRGYYAMFHQRQIYL